ncbi:MAG: aspartate-semialdehyde dehydrogenase, partial [Deltaproteobacteria bacterium]|nr:aspartate-semialdehyde dehydrogenase [Deltaproteobacteria bacterium]
SWPEMVDNVIPFIKGEEEKSEQEPLKIWGTIKNGQIEKASAPAITAQCLRVPVSDGHMAAVFVAFERKPSKEQILAAWKEYAGRPQQLKLPSAPTPFLTYFEEENRPQTRVDRDLGNGQAVSIGRLRADAVFDWRFVALSHNTVRGAAGGAVLTAELLKADGYLSTKS